MLKQPLWIILGVALLLRAGLLAAGWSEPRRFHTPDSYDYDTLAYSLLERSEFARDDRPELFRTPGYPVFLAAIYGPTDGSVRAAIAVQILLDVLLCFLVYRLGLALCSHRVGLVAAAVQAVSPAAIVASARLLSGSLFAVLLTGALVLLVSYLRDSRFRSVLAGGVLMGLACLVRPVGLPAAAIAAVVLLAGAKRRRGAIIFAAVVAAVVGPWMLRNYARGGYRQLAGVADFNLFYCNAMSLVEADPEISLSDAQRRLAELPDLSGASWPTPAKLNDPAFLLACRREGLAIIAAHPAAYAKMHLRTTMNVFLPAATDVLEVLGVTAGGKGTLGIIRREGLPAGVRHYFGGTVWPLWLCVPMVLIVLGKYAAAVVGAVRYVRWRMGAGCWLVFATVACFVLIPGPVAHARFRVPVAGLLSIAAGAGIVWMIEKIRTLRKFNQA